MDELIQGVRLRLWRTQGEGAQNETVTATYVHQAARSAALDIVRGRRTIMASASQSIEDTVLHDPGTAADALLEEQETAARIMDAVNELAPDRRAAVKLHLAGYRRDEIASMLGWSDIRTRNLVHRGIADLRTRLTALGLSPSGVS